MARFVARQAAAIHELELLLEPTLSICCFRYVSPHVADLDRLNQMLHRRLMRENRSMPSTTRVGGRLALRPCFVGARTTEVEARELVDDVLRIGAALVRELGHDTSPEELASAA
jgi:aromatic-L-amino-acid decarboxylase